MRLGMKTAKVFQNGQSQAVRLPKEFRVDTKEVYVKRVGDSIVLTPKGRSWKAFMESLDKFTPDFMSERKQPALEKREDMFE